MERSLRPAASVRAHGQDLTCAATAVLLDRVRRLHGADGIARLLDGARSPRTAAFLEDLANWVSLEEALALWEAAARVCDDPRFARHSGADFVAHLTGSGNSAVLRSLGSPEALLRSLALAAKRFSTVADLEPVEVRPGHAEVRMTACDGYAPHRTHCEWTAGLLTQSTALFGLAPASVEHGPCEADGAEACVFRVTWDASADVAMDPEARVASLSSQLEGMSERLQIVFDTATDLIGSSDLDGTLARITERAALQVRAPGYLLAVKGTGDAPHLHRRGFDADEAAAIAARVLDPAADPLPEHWLVVDVRSDLHHYGALVAVQKPGVGFFAHERQLLEVYARYAATALDTATALAEAKELQREAQRRDEESRTLLQLARRLAGAASSAQVAQRLADAIPVVVDCDRVSVYVWSEEEQELRRAAINLAGVGTTEAVGRSVFLPAEHERLAGWLRHPDPAPLFIDLEVEGVRSQFGDLAVEAAVAVPIATPQRFLGCFIASAIVGRERLASTPALLDRLSGVAAHAVTAMENGRLVDQITHQATHDQLTGVLNRMGFAERMSAACRAAGEGEGCVLFYLDLDGFKPINDLHGHEIGDDLLRSVARRLEECLRPGDTVARLGGDEFAVLVAPADVDGAEIDALAGRLATAFAEPFVLGGHRLSIGASLGRAAWPQDGALPEDLLRVADASMYAAKRATAAIAATNPETAADDAALRALSAVAHRLVAPGGGDDVDAALARAACAVTGASGATVFAEHADGGLVVTHAAGWNRTGARVLPGAHSGANLVHVTGVPLFAPDAQNDARLSGANLRQSGAASVAVWPVQIDGRTAGAVLTWWAAPVAGLSERTERLLGMIADAAAIAVERRSLFGSHELISRIDPLTGIANRRALDAELERRLIPEASSSVAVALLDLDRFTAFNERHGHLAGDDLLRACAEAWRVETGRDEVLALSGPGQFAVLLHDRTPDEALALVDALRARTPDGQACSAGVAVWDGEELPAALLARAGFALHRAKVAGRDTTSIAPFATGRAPHDTRRDPGNERRRTAPDVSAAELRHALAEGRFELHYQPLFGASDGALTGLEALVRLRDRSGELVAPGRFIHVAERSGLIVGLGAWVIERTCMQVAAWRAEGLRVPPVAVNLSPRQLDGPDPYDVVASALRRHGLRPRDFYVEVTESALVSGAEALVGVLERLRALGVHVALDDFGAGHSSLARLAVLPVSVLKVDRGLTADVGRDARATALLEGIVDLARATGLETVVEGVETREQADACRGAGATWLQGFLLARPEPADVVVRRLAARAAVGTVVLTA